MDALSQHSSSRSRPETDASFSALFDASVDAVLLATPEGNVIRANTAACRMFGLAEEDWRRRGWAVAVDEADPQWRRVLAERRRLGSYSGELTLRRADGTRFPAEITTTLLQTLLGETRASIIVRDISHRKLVQSALHDGEARPRATGEGQSEIVGRFLADGTCIYVNDAYCRFFGKTRFQLEGRRWQPLAVAGDATVVETRLRAMTPGNPVVVVEHRVHTGTGEVRWVQFVNRGFYDANGQLLAYQAVGWDITARKQLELELRENRNRLERIIETTPSGILIISLDGIITSANAAAERIAGLPRRRFVGQRYDAPRWRLSTADGAPLAANQLPIDSILLEGRTIRDLEVSFEQPDRGRVIVSLNAAPLRDDHGRVQAVVVAFDDITERKRMEAALVENEARFRAVVEDQTEIICRIHADGTYVFVSEVFCRFFGLTREELLGRRWTGQVLDEEVAGIEGRVREITPSTPVIIHEVRVRAGSGQVRWMQFINRGFFDATGRLVEVQAVGRDVTDRKQYEQALLASQQMLQQLAAHIQAVREEERTKVAREIHDVMAQELTRLKIDLVWLQSRLGRAEAAPDPRQLSPRIADMIRMADTAIQSVQRIATGLRPAVLDSLGLCAAVEWAGRDFEEHAGIRCDVQVPEGELAVAPEAATAAFRVLQESLTNIIRHAQATQVGIELRPEAGQVWLRVQDNGRGLPADKIVSPLSIGLAGMRERALGVGGRLEIRSEPGAGTCVEMIFPAASAPRRREGSA